jgi:Protein of unknown function (DUF3102)
MKHAGSLKRPPLTPVARPLPVLIPLIRAEVIGLHAEAAGRYRAIGALLREAKGQVQHGAWGPWLRANFALNATTARAYMRFAAQNGDASPFSNRAAFSLPDLACMPSRTRRRLPRLVRVEPWPTGPRGSGGTRSGRCVGWRGR